MLKKCYLIQNRNEIILMINIEKIYEYLINYIIVLVSEWILITKIDGKLYRIQTWYIWGIKNIK